MTEEQIIEKVKDSAFPQIINHTNAVICGTGLTKREYFAAMAMQGILAKIGPDWVGNEQIAEEAVMIANKLVESLNNTDNPNL